MSQAHWGITCAVLPASSSQTGCLAGSSLQQSIMYSSGNPKSDLSRCTQTGCCAAGSSGSSYGGSVPAGPGSGTAGSPISGGLLIGGSSSSGGSSNGGSSSGSSSGGSASLGNSCNSGSVTGHPHGRYSGVTFPSSVRWSLESGLANYALWH